MSVLMHPPILNDLGHAGDTGLPTSINPTFQDALDLCSGWGYKIEAAGGRVRLLFDNEQLVSPWIERETPAIAWEKLQTAGYLRLQSTNTEAHILAEHGASEGTLVFAEEQTEGRGRQDRKWHSPSGTSLYCTLIVRPKQPRPFWPLLTHVASVALFRAFQELAVRKLVPFPLDAEIKWPNDVLLAGKKCAGILLEALWGDGGNSAALVGFGINVHNGSVPADLADQATCVDEMAGTPVPRRQLLTLYLKHFQICYLMFEQGRHKEILDHWKSSSSMWEATQIYIGKGEGRREAITCGLNDLGALVVRTPDGKMETLYAEDVSVTKKKV